LSKFLADKKELLHPNLRTHGYKVTSEDTEFKKVKYNCVAWAALTDTEKWWEPPGTEPGTFWPKGILADGSFQSYVELFKLLKYKVLPQFTT